MWALSIVRRWDSCCRLCTVHSLREEGSMPIWWSNALLLGSCLQLVSVSVPMPVAPSHDFHHLMWSMVAAIFLHPSVSLSPLPPLSRFLRLKMLDHCPVNPGYHGLTSVVPNTKDTRGVHTSARDTLASLESLVTQCALSQHASAHLKAVAAQCLQVGVYALIPLVVRSHSISFTRAQGIPKFEIGLGKGKDGKVGGGLVEGVYARVGGGGVCQSLPYPLHFCFLGGFSCHFCRFGTVCKRWSDSCCSLWKPFFLFVASGSAYLAVRGRVDLFVSTYPSPFPSPFPSPYPSPYPPLMCL